MNIMVEALLNTLMGMGTVFAVLIFMSLIISVFKYIPGFVEGFGKKDKADAAKAAAPAPQRPVIEEEEEELVDDGELVAVITAAIMATYGGGASSADKLVVRSIKRAKRNRR